MKPVEQTILSLLDGNCFAACVASILGLPIESVPNFRGDGWWHEWQDWLKGRNLAFLGWPSDELGNDQVRADTLRGYSICTVRYELPSGGLNHSVVAFNGEMVWNPHPLRDTRRPDSIVDWIVFRVLDPSAVNAGPVEVSKTMTDAQRYNYIRHIKRLQLENKVLRSKTQITLDKLVVVVLD